ncbi:MAG: radical SAM protein [Lachnospiraceae bacterium]|nr:radical SAM protein [Lachnospiraceae bacterium]
MKWRNKGHEYERYAECFKNRKIWIYGAGYKGAVLYEKLKSLNCVAGFIENNSAKKLTEGYLGEKVISFRNVKDDYRDKYIVIIAAQQANALDMALHCRKAGFIDGYTLFYSEDFLRSYFDIYALYHNEMVCAEFVSLQISSFCNLKCKGCLAFAPYDRHMKHFTIDEIRKSVDETFQNIDYINLLDLCGGEPFLSPLFPEAIKYVGQNYREKIGILRTVTNGSVVPSDELCKALVQYGVLVFLDDYQEYVPVCAKNYNKVYCKLKDAGVNFYVNKVDNWIDLGIETGCKMKYEEATRMFDECDNTRVAILNSKLFACDYAAYASESKVFPESECEYLDFSVERDKAEVLEFLKGYTESGSAGMCHYCNGAIAINKHLIGVATQIRK